MSVTYSVADTTQRIIRVHRVQPSHSCPCRRVSPSLGPLALPCTRHRVAPHSPKPPSVPTTTICHTPFASICTSSSSFHPSFSLPSINPPSFFPPDRAIIHAIPARSDHNEEKIVADPSIYLAPPQSAARTTLSPQTLRQRLASLSSILNSAHGPWLGPSLTHTPPPRLARLGRRRQH